MTIWVTSDLHHDHKNIIKYCPESRGHFSSVEEMNEVMTNNINSVVAEEDTLIILGDISFGSPKRACEFLMGLNGKKIIIHGNHDRKLIASPDFQHCRGMMGIVEDSPYKVMTHTVDNVKHGVVLFHFPIEEWDGGHHGAFHLHGHRHSPNSQKITQRRMDVGVDSNFMMPYKLDDVLRKLSSYSNGKHHN